MEKALSTISQGGVIILMGGIIMRGLGFLNRVIIAKFFGPSSLGLLALGLMWISIISKLSLGGFPSALKKFVPIHLTDDEDRMVRSTIFTVFTISVSLSIIGGSLLFIFSKYISVSIFNSKALIPILRIIAILIPFQVIYALLTNLFLTFKKVKYRTILKIGYNILKLLMVILVVFIGGTILNVTMAYLFTVIILVLIGTIILEKKVYPFLKKQTKSDGSLTFTPKRILNFSMPLLFSAALIMIMGKADTFMLGYFTNEELVGIYNLVLPLAFMLLIFLRSINQIFFPVISQLHADKKLDELSRTFTTVLRWDFLLTFPFFVFLCIFSKPILNVFFPEYVEGWKALSILSVGMMFRSGFGPVGNILKTFGRTKFIFKINLVLVGINLGLNVILIPIYGLAGAATATAIAFSLNNILEMWKVRDLLKLRIIKNLYGKYFISSLFPAILIFVILTFVNPNRLWILILFSIYISLNFVLLLLLGGFIHKDIYLFETLDLILRKLKIQKVSFKSFVEKYIE